MAPWLPLLDDCLAAAGGLDGAAEARPAKQSPAIIRATPYKFDKVPRRDERFPDPYNMGVNAEVFLYDETMPAGRRRC